MSKEQINKPIVILARTQMSKNLGSIARVMSNFDFSEMRLVAPTCSHFSEEAMCLARARAEHILHNAKIFTKLEDAVADVDYLVAFSAKDRGEDKRFDSLYSLPDIVINRKRPAFLFGPENNGLSIEDLVFADTLTKIDVSSYCPSMNISHAVAVACHEYNRSYSLKTSEQKQSNDANVVNKERINWLSEFVLSKLSESKFFNTSTPERGEFESNSKRLYTKSKLVEIFNRSNLADFDVDFLSTVFSVLHNKNYTD